MVRAIVLVVVAGCVSFDMSPAQPWVPIEQIGPPLQPELVATATANPFRDSHPVTSSPLQIVTYNVQYGPDIPGAIAAIADDPELAFAGVILVQEIEAYPDEGQSRAAQLAAGLGLGYAYVPARVRDTGTHGLAILSAFPIRSVEKMDLSDSGYNNTEHRIAIAAELEVDGRTLRVINLHLDTGLAAKERIAQLHPVAFDAPAATVVGGDFNTAWLEFVSGVPIPQTTGASDQAPVVDSYMVSLGYDAPTKDSGPTEHMLGYEQRLDSIYTRGMSASFGGVVRSGPSDHWPMWIDVSGL